MKKLIFILVFGFAVISNAKDKCHPTLSLKVTCIPAMNLIRFAQHAGVYTLSEALREMGDQNILTCRYQSSKWMSDYSVSGMYLRASNAKQLKDIILGARDLTPDETHNVTVAEPTLEITSEPRSWFGSKDTLYVDLGLGKIDPRSQDPTRLVLKLDESAYRNHQGGGYFLGEACKLEVQEL